MSISRIDGSFDIDGYRPVESVFGQLKEIVEGGA